MRVAVIGAGIMGSGIAQLAAMSGGEARVRDISPAQLAPARASVAKSLQRFVRSDRLKKTEAAAALERITFTTDLAEALEGADTVIEAIPEVLELKHETLADVVAQAPAEALLGTNTSQLSITAIAAGLGDHAPRLVGIHFFNPPVMMRLVEIIAGLRTREEEVARARSFAEWLSRESVVCRRDSPGFITSRAYSALRLECVRMLEEGVATAEDIDTAMRLGFNFPVGPLELGDANGLDTFVRALDGLTAAHGERFRPTVGLRDLVAANRLGRKTGAGFYDYDADGRRMAPER